MCSKFFLALFLRVAVLIFVSPIQLVHTLSRNNNDNNNNNNNNSGTVCFGNCAPNQQCERDDDCAVGACTDGNCYDPHAECDANAMVLSPALMSSALSGDCGNTDCGVLATAVNDAAAAYHMQCPLRLTALVALANATSNGFRDLSTATAAGAIPTWPYLWRQACVEDAAVSAAFATAFPTCAAAMADDGDASTSVCDCGADLEAAALIGSSPELALRVGAWWLSGGVLATGIAPWGVCGDLRAVMDQGLGESGTPPNGWSPGSGFYHVLGCYTSFDTPAALAAASLASYGAVRRVVNGEAAFVVPPSCADGVQNQGEACVDGGAVCPLQCWVGEPCGTSADCAGRLQCSADTGGGGGGGANGTSATTCVEVSVPECTPTVNLTTAVAAEALGLSAAQAADAATAAQLTHLVAAMHAQGLHCDLRAAAFLAQVRTATSQLTTLYSRDAVTGTPLAGALALRPAHARAACAAHPATIEAAFVAEAGVLAPACLDRGTAPCQCMTNAQAAAVVARPEHAFAAAAWWFVHGVDAWVEGCGDLRVDAEVGLGTPGDYYGLQPADEIGGGNPYDALTQASPGTGMFKIATCLSEYRPTLPNEPARLAAYEVAVRVVTADAGFTLPPLCADGAQNGDETDADCGGACFVSCRDGQGCGADADCASGLCGAGGVCAAVEQEVAGFTVTLEQMVASMGGTCANCAAYHASMLTALEEAGMLTPLRVANFLAQVRHETAGLSILYQPLDNGAGALHMLPFNFRYACEDVPGLRQAFADAFPACAASRSTPCGCGSDVEAGRIVQRQEFAFRTATWWYTMGAAKLMGRPCGDLRPDADAGLGTPPASGVASRQDPGTGYYKTSACIFGFAYDAGGPQRLRYWDVTSGIFLAGDAGVGDTCSTVCRPGEYEAEACTAEHDRSCATCAPCAPGSYASSPCGGTSAGTCAACRPPCDAATEAEVQACTATTDRVCEAVACPVCAADEFEAGGCAERGDAEEAPSRDCQPCAPPCAPGTQFEAAACSADADRQCVDCSPACGDGEWEERPCDAAGDRVCRACTVCGSDEYQVAACTATADTVCHVCSTCGRDQYQRAACSADADTECAWCSTCGSDEYLVAGCTADSDRVCRKCTQCADLEQYRCTSTQDAVCIDCGTCDAGSEYVSTVCRMRGRRNFYDTQCSACSACPEGQVIVGGCDGVSDTQCATPTCPPCGDPDAPDNACPPPCAHDGACAADAAAVGGFTCTCPAAWAGPTCDAPRTACNADGNPCANGGVCTPDAGTPLTAFTCACAGDWHGATCGDLDCVMGAWGAWGACQGACGGAADSGVATRARTVATAAVGAGATCDGAPMTEERPCTPPTCSVDCRVSGWGEWGACSMPCNGGVRHRSRTVEVEPQGDGSACPALEDAKACNRNTCSCNADADEDGVVDCEDACLVDPHKSETGQCGCGVSDDDSDGDGVADCVDGCVDDPDKSAPGVCGCGVSDNDSDGDGWLDHCAVPDGNPQDGCPSDPAKSAPGVCGCGVSDVDSDDDGTPDCEEPCLAVTSPCLHGGVCTSAPGTAFTCACADGYSGDTCETDVNECDPNPCANGGVCHDKVAAFECECAAGWTGDTCAEERTGPEPVDCVLGDWSTPTPCSALCGGGVRVSTRPVLVPAAYGGAACLDLVREAECNTGPCEDGDGGDADDDPAPPPAGGGACQGCWPGTSGPCQSFLTVCYGFFPGTSTCPGGTTSCSGGGGGGGRADVDPSVDCETSSWSDWGACSAQCGGGVQVRSRMALVPRDGPDGAPCGALSEQRACNAGTCDPVDCVMEEWGAWGVCDAPCGGGTQTRTRGVAVAPVHGGAECPGTTVQQQACNVEECNDDPVDCVVSAWGDWSACGDGPDQHRTRSVLVLPVNEGMPCPALTETRTNVCPVDCDVSPWTAWSPCSAACGGGTSDRSRTVLRTPANGGDPCPPQLTESRPCNAEACGSSCTACWPGTSGPCKSAAGVCYGYFPGMTICPGATTECVAPSAVQPSVTAALSLSPLYAYQYSESVQFAVIMGLAAAAGVTPEQVQPVAITFDPESVGVVINTSLVLLPGAEEAEATALVDILVAANAAGPARLTQRRRGTRGTTSDGGGATRVLTPTTAALMGVAMEVAAVVGAGSIQAEVLSAAVVVGGGNGDGGAPSSPPGGDGVSGQAGTDGAGTTPNPSATAPTPVFLFIGVTVGAALVVGAVGAVVWAVRRRQSTVTTSAVHVVAAHKVTPRSVVTTASGVSGSSSSLAWGNDSASKGATGRMGPAPSSGTLSSAMSSRLGFLSGSVDTRVQPVSQEESSGMQCASTAELGLGQAPQQAVDLPLDDAPRLNVQDLLRTHGSLHKASRRGMTAVSPLSALPGSPAAAL